VHHVGHLPRIINNYLVSMSWESYVKLLYKLWWKQQCGSYTKHLHLSERV